MAADKMAKLMGNDRLRTAITNSARKTPVINNDLASVTDRRHSIPVYIAHHGVNRAATTLNRKVPCVTSIKQHVRIVFKSRNYRDNVTERHPNLVFISSTPEPSPLN